MVDETNGIIEDEPHTQRKNFEVDTPEEWIVCDMGHKHITKEITYKIPERKG